MFTVGHSYTRDRVQHMLSVPEPQRGGSWDTGYTQYNGSLYIFCNVGAPGRTGHDYPNRWDGDELIWSAKTGTKISQPLIQGILSGSLRAHVFYRLADRSPFLYAGIGNVAAFEDITPVQIRWSFDTRLPLKSVLDSAAISSALEAIGFELGPVKVKTRRASRPPITAYVKLDSNAYRLVIDPAYEDRLTALLSISGVLKTPDFYYHNSTMAALPERLHTGKTPTHYGFAFDFASESALLAFVEILAGNPIGPSGQDTMSVDPKTETEVTRAARLGQQKFRSDLLEYWNGRCALTGFELPELLRASHIKPWCDCEPKERIDPNNGLLLTVHIDGLFDRGLISFDPDGKLLCSSKLADSHLMSLGITRELKVDGLSSGHHKYLKFHRDLHGYK